VSDHQIVCGIAQPAYGAWPAETTAFVAGTSYQKDQLIGQDIRLSQARLTAELRNSVPFAPPMGLDPVQQRMLPRSIQFGRCPSQLTLLRLHIRTHKCDSRKPFPKLRFGLSGVLSFGFRPAGRSSINQRIDEVGEQLFPTPKILDRCRIIRVG
jgi:hypothetical protein